MKHFQKKIFSLKQVSGLLTAVFLGIAALAYGVTLPFPKFVAGDVISSSQVNSNFKALKDAVDPLEAQMTSGYTKFENLNYDFVTVTSTETPLMTTAGSHMFTKNLADSDIEVFVHSRFSSGTFSGTNGVLFTVRVDDEVLPTVATTGAMTTSDTIDFLSLYAVFKSLPAGLHTVSLWGQAVPFGSSTGVLVDSGGFGGSIIVKEHGKS